MGWWSVKALRFSRLLVVLGLLVIVLFGWLFWIFDNGNPFRVLADLVITIAVLMAVMFLVSLAAWFVYALRRTTRIYMSPSRKAVIVMAENRRNGRWELKNHVVQRTGREFGAALRNQMAKPVQAAATAAGVEIYGKAANATVQGHYLKQFASWGLVPRGKKGVVWKP